MKILMTGYGPFGEHPVNPSWEVVKAISEDWDSEDELMVREMPVSYNYVETHIPSLLKEYKPNLVIHVGVGIGNNVHLETCAHSSGYIRLDIDGHCGPITSKCVCLKTSLDIDKIVAECSAFPKEVPTVVKSSEAGRYLCEYIFYTSLHVCEEEKIKSSVIFVHVPEFSETISLEIEKYVLKKIMEFCLEQASIHL